MKIPKLFILMIFIVIGCFASDLDELKDIYNKKLPLYEKLKSDFDTYPNMTDYEKQEYTKNLQELLDIEFLKNEIKLGGDTQKNTFIVFSPYINLYSYFIAKFYPDESMIKAVSFLMSGVIQYDTNDVYMETYALLLAYDNKFDLALEFYPKYLEVYDDKDVKNNFEMIKDMALLNAIETNNIELLQKLYDLKVDFNSFSKKDIRAPIFVAMYDKQRENSAKFLLDHGVDVNSTYNDEQILFNGVENHFSEEFVKYLIQKGCNKNYYKDSLSSSVGNNAYIYANVFRSDFYSQELLNLLKPDDYTNIKLAYLYLKYKLFGDLAQFIKNNNDITIFEKDDYINFLSELTRIYSLSFSDLSQQQKDDALEAMKVLIEKGADLNKTIMDNRNSFENIVFGNHFPKEFITFVLTNIDPNKKYFIQGRKTNWTPIFGAIVTNNLEAFDALIQKGADIKYVDEKGVDSFYLAVYDKNIEMAQKLIESGFEINLEPTTTKHPLAIAVLNNDIQMIEYLEMLGFDRKKELFGKKNLLEFALTNPNKDLGREEQPLIINTQMYKYLINSFKDELNNPIELGYHNLLLAKNGEDSFEGLKYLLEMGEDVKINNSDYSPLQFVSFYDDHMIDKIQLLLNEKIDINHQDKDGDTPLHQFVLNYISIQNKKPDNIQNKQDDINEILEMLKTSVKSSIKQDSLNRLKQAIKYLVDNGADINIKNSQNKSPYELAMLANVKDKELIEWLSIK